MDKEQAKRVLESMAVLEKHIDQIKELCEELIDDHYTAKGLAIEAYYGVKPTGVDGTDKEYCKALDKFNEEFLNSNGQ